MRVLGVLGYYPPTSRVGAFLATHRLLAHLVARGHEVGVRTYAKYEPFDLDDVRVAPFGTDCHEEAARADVVVSHYGDDGRAARSAHDLNKIDVRLVHGSVSSGSFGPAPTLAVFSSEAQRATFGYDGPSLVVHPYTSRVEAAPGDRITIVGMSEAKGGSLFDRVSRTMTAHRFLAVRNGYGDQIHVRHKNVETMPVVVDIADVLSRTRVLMFPSRSETWGMIGVEALSAGIPVVATDLPALRESLGDAAIFCPADDGQAWVDALTSLDDGDTWAERSTASLARFRRLEDHRDRFVDALEALC